MEADLRGRNGEEPVWVCRAFFGALQSVDFLVPLECISVHVHEMSPQAPIWVTPDSKSTQTNVKWGGAYRSAGRDCVIELPGGFLPSSSSVAPSLGSRSRFSRLVLNRRPVHPARGQKLRKRYVSPELESWRNSMGFRLPCQILASAENNA